MAVPGAHKFRTIARPSIDSAELGSPAPVHNSIDVEKVMPMNTLRKHDYPYDQTEMDERSSRDAYVEALAQRVRPLFEEAASHARLHGLEVVVDLVLEHQRPRLILAVSRPGQEHVSSFSLIANPEAQRVLHETYYAESGDIHRQETQLAALNEKVIDTRLAGFFSKAFALPLDYLRDKHPIGFW